MENRSHQFTHSNAERRASVVYGSVGKGGLFIPRDFIKGVDIGQDSEATVGTESESLLPPILNGGYRRKSSIQHELLVEERNLLKDHNIPIRPDITDAELEDTFEEAVLSHKISETTSKIELKALVKSSVPLVLTFLLQNSLSTVSVFTVGNFGAATELAAVSMGAMTANITGYATIQGIATALDTLCPQAYGAKRYTLVGIYLQKCIALIFTVLLPILFVWLFYGYDLICLLVPDRETAKYAALYLQYLAPGIPAYILFECGKRYLQAQGIYHISTYVLLFAAPCNLVMNIVFVRSFGYTGAPIAVAINYWFMALGLFVATVYFVKAEDTPTGIHPLACWGGLNVRQAFNHWGNLIHLAIPGLIMLEAEFLAFEILTLLASYLGTYQLAAQAIGTTIASLTYQVPFAIGIASSTRIANYLGAGLEDSAKKTTKVALSFGLLVSFFNFLVLFIFKVPIARAFTKDEKVIHTVGGIMWLVALMQLSDAMNANSAGCLRGQGQTKIGGIVNLISYYVVGLPLSIYLSFYSPWKGSLDGLWIGSCVALTIIGVVQSYFALNADFGKLRIAANKRTNLEM
jgi:MATE family multidrug resistance protein